MEGQRAALKLSTSTREGLEKKMQVWGRNVLKMEEEGETEKGSKQSLADMTVRTGIAYEDSNFSRYPGEGEAQGKRCPSPSYEPGNRSPYLAEFETKIHTSQKAQETKYHFQPEAMAPASAV